MFQKIGRTSQGELIIFLPNWSSGKGGVPVVGGAMDLVHVAKGGAVLNRSQDKTGRTQKGFQAAQCR